LVTAQHVPGKLNTVADSESRVFNDSREWKIDLQTSYLLRLSGKHSLGATSPGSSGRSSSPSSQHETPSNRPREPPKYTSNVSPITLSRVSHFRGQYQAMGLSNDVIVTVARL
ncbi:unnamed protein product, partial [Porites evermanni]